MQPAEATTPLRTLSLGYKGRRPMMGAAVPFRMFMKAGAAQLWPELTHESGEPIAATAPVSKGE